MAEFGQLIDRMAGFVHFLGEVLDRFGGARDHVYTILSFLIGRQCSLRGSLRVTRHFLGGGGHFLHGGGQLVELL